MNLDEATLLQRANEEREKIFQRYERGREPGAEIDPWEDPGFEVYHQTDRYGFIHDKRLPQKPDPNETKARSIELERVKKWLKMLNRWSSKDTKEKLHKRIYKGVPDKVRSRVWLKLLNIEETMQDNKNVYSQMLKLARKWSTEARQIDSDVNRQFREHLFYRERYSIKQRSLFNVLTAYSMYNTEVGYCQGMSGVAGVLLMYMDEEEAFWALSTLLAEPRFAMHGLYVEGFPKLTRFLQHHDRIIAKYLPRLKRHFDQYELDAILYSLKWFFVIFIERIPFSLCLRVWDIYLMDGERVVTAMAYTILRLHKNKLLKLKDMDLIVQYLQTRLHKDFGYDDDHVIKVLEQSMDELRKSRMDLPLKPSNSIELPKKPFGEFIEPNLEAKIGRRKSEFTTTEKTVTEDVKMRREVTAQEIAAIANIENTAPEIGIAIRSSNGQLNTDDIIHNIADSEDGGSLLGSSRKSLADTSVTSTADLSVFSGSGGGGHRSQLGAASCFDDQRSVLSEENAVSQNGEEDEDDEEGGESSPGSAFCSLSVVGRTPSVTMMQMMTPTPRAISPQDIVRIYVPPAGSEEGGGTTTGTTSPMPHMNGKSSSMSNNTMTTSRRSSLTRKSIDTLNEAAFGECAHMRSSSSSASLAGKKMTSFEELAASRYSINSSTIEYHQLVNDGQKFASRYNDDDASMYSSSLLATPVNEQTPPLPKSNSVHIFPHSSSGDRFIGTVLPPVETNGGQPQMHVPVHHNSRSMDERIAISVGGAYEFRNSNHSTVGGDSNKIRIKVNHSPKN